MQRQTPLASVWAAQGFWTPAVVLMRNTKFAGKALVISLVFLVPTLALIAWLEVKNHSTMLLERQNATRQHVEMAHVVLAWAHEQETTGKLNRPQAQDLAKGIISKMRYDKSEYFWINDMTPVVVMHPINTKPGSPDPVEKRSYVSGIYIDDLRAARTEASAAALEQPGGEIATSSREQASGVEQVGQSIQELERSTQQNAALVEETTSAAAALRQQAEILQSEIANFRVA